MRMWYGGCKGLQRDAKGTQVKVGVRNMGYITEAAQFRRAFGMEAQYLCLAGQVEFNPWRALKMKLKLY